MWQFFTERGKKVVQLAHREALRMGHDVIGTEHILLGLLVEGEGVAAQVLNSLGVNFQEVRRQTEELVGKGQPILKPIDLPLSPRAKRVLDLAIKEARNMGVNYVGTEHVLLGLLAEGEGVAAQILLSSGVDTVIVQREISRFIANNEADRGVQPDLSGEGQRSLHSKTPTLDQLGIDLSEKSRKDELDPVIGRDKEIQRVIQILARRTKNNPVLLGDPGVGKTAIVEGLAQKIQDGNIAEILRGKKIVQLNIGNLVAGTKYRGEFEERMRKLLKELRETGDVIIFIDEIHSIIGAGGAEGAVDAANILKPSLSRGEFQVIGATTLDEYRKYIEKDAALERRFQPVMVEEPSVDDTISILEGLRDRYESHHRVKISDDALVAAARLSSRYITERFLPDKAIDLIDEAAARARLKTMEIPANLKDIEHDLEEVRKEKEAAVTSQEFEKAARLRDTERKISEELEEKKKDWQSRRYQEKPLVSFDDIATIVSEWTNIPVTQLTEEETQRLLRMEEEIHCRLIGQEEAVSAVARAIRRARSGMKDPRRPVGSFLFLGPTGVGKTELARRLADFLFGSEDAMIRLDMSEFMERHEVGKLIGAPPGYVGYDEGGKLTEAIRRRPYSVVLFDEIEKAHEDVFNILLQILEDGRLTDGQGHTVDFRNAVIIMTSNIGAKDWVKGTSLGFSISGEADGYFDWDKTKSDILDAVQKTFRPEFINRVDEMVVFRPLSKKEMLVIVDIMLSDVRERLRYQDIDIKVSEEAKAFILEKGYNPRYGARPLRRKIQQLIEDRMADMLLEGKIKKGSLVSIDEDKGEMTFECTKPQKRKKEKKAAV
ncbi:MULTISPECIES: ATP-dependent Clp protease ATP-binding subunit [Aminobacterium]|jgi:ATP-dependent Clp protease ATP-binding subunit ClpC|uniref:ATPase AAA-2 domain protein n=1 Tax=Aminobacterium colombiense (strain DSM 12261 / ALA-1) TaxID=572547 RepID=D5EDR7_AMICL|nr:MULTISPECIES: ATP-dependent Clp protease ATP-binding subunit [Aminobacterium]ADE56699.1 ATPase AAA-2 domain protein [Aminobacterium colombiense DSM 12261]MDD2379253.1 ATP-dependent Clp protease ATP-binding subunit [Aminobacterium colombiense]MDD4585932.1 ATP-dependent Clp protease ATP-binding subunit [Aminobacterium colombiense]